MRRGSGQAGEREGGGGVPSLNPNPNPNPSPRREGDGEGEAEGGGAGARTVGVRGLPEERVLLEQAEHLLQPTALGHLGEGEGWG